MTKIIIGEKEFDTLLAISPEEQERGLMFVKWPPPVMSFVYGNPCINKFWMKNCYCPLDIIFCRNGKIINIVKGEPNSTKILGPDEPTDLVVEMPYGTCKINGFDVGCSVDLVGRRA